MFLQNIARYFYMRVFTTIIADLNCPPTRQIGKQPIHCIAPKSNGKSIFLPASGYRRGGSLYRAGDWIGYWSASLFTHGSSSDAQYFLFFDGDQYGPSVPAGAGFRCIPCVLRGRRAFRTMSLCYALPLLTPITIVSAQPYHHSIKRAIVSLAYRIINPSKHRGAAGLMALGHTSATDA
ncbi:MAG: hypothetical protein IJ761_01120 [Bacteroidales bacterium]|nr:hypothetical protein [Bacteroidales bacterium]